MISLHMVLIQQNILTFKMPGIRPLTPVQNSVLLEADGTKNIEFRDKFTRCRKEKKNQMV